jgi:hypothetical protein
MVLASEIGKRHGVTVALLRLFAAAPPEENSWLNTQSCDFPFKFVSVKLDGATGVCCGTQIRKGNIFTDGFAKTWNDPFWVKLRETVNTDHELDICRNCMLCKQNPDSLRGHIPNAAPDPHCPEAPP